MGFILAEVLGLFTQPLLSSRLARGELGLKKTFWLYGVLIGGGIYVLGYWLFARTLADPYGDIESGLKQGIFIAGFYSIFVFLGIWRAAKSQPLIQRFVVRYFSVFFLSTFAVSVYVGWTYYVVIALVIFLANKLSRLAPAASAAD